MEPPPDLSSQDWVDDFNQTKAYGAINSTIRISVFLQVPTSMSRGQMLVTLEARRSRVLRNQPTIVAEDAFSR
jgi:hypothetical protein